MQDLKLNVLPVVNNERQKESFKRLLNKYSEIFKDYLSFKEIALVKNFSRKLSKVDLILVPSISHEGLKYIIQSKSKINVPIMFLSQEYGTAIMWEWERAKYLTEEGLQCFVPYDVENAKTIFEIMLEKLRFKNSCFLIFEEKKTVGAGMWRYKKVEEKLEKNLGIKTITLSPKKLNKRIKSISDDIARDIWKKLKIKSYDVNQSQILSAVKFYLALKEQVEEFVSSKSRVVQGIGLSCWGDEGKARDYVAACLAYTLLFEEMGILWGCERDIVSMATMVIMDRIFNMPLMMTNIYPFLMREPTIRHEKIPDLPKVKDPHNYILIAHCGYMGIVPKKYTTQYKLTSSVLSLFKIDTIALDCRIPTGKITLTKLNPHIDSLHIVEGTLEKYVQYPGSDCRNGGIIKIKDGYRFMENIYSHHYCIVQGIVDKVRLSLFSKIFNLNIEEH